MSGIDAVTLSAAVLGVICAITWHLTNPDREANQ